MRQQQKKIPTPVGFHTHSILSVLSTLFLLVFKSETMTNTQNHLTSLSNELQLEIASFLPPSDALHLTETCTTLHRDLPLASLNPPFSLSPIQEWSGDHDSPRRGPRVPLLYTTKTHSITLKGRQWCGDGPCSLYLVAFDRADRTVDTKTFSNGTVIVESPIAQGKVSQFYITFRPDASKIYYLWYHGEVVQTNRIIVHTLIYDNSKRTISKEYRLASNPVSPLRSMLAHVMWHALSVR